MNIYREQTEQVIDMAFEPAKVTTEFLDGYWGGAQYAASDITDLEYVTWFEKKQIEDPDYVRALMFVPGGQREYQRYLKAKERLLVMVSEVDDGIRP